MGSLDGLKTRRLLRRGQIVQWGTDGPVAIRLRNKAGKAVTSVTVTTGTNIVLIDSVGTTTVAFATYTTIGAVVGAINATADWEAKALDALLSQASTSTLLDGAITVGTDGNGNAVYDVKQDTSTGLQIAVCLSPFRSFDNPKGHRVNLVKLEYAVNMGTAAVNSAQLWLRKDGVESQVFGALSVDTTDTTVFDYTGGTYEFSGKDDEEMIFIVKDAATLSDATTNYVQAVGSIE
jgi:hypothetical protein